MQTIHVGLELMCIHVNLVVDEGTLVKTEFHIRLRIDSFQLVSLDQYGFFHAIFEVKLYKTNHLQIAYNLLRYQLCNS